MKDKPKQLTEIFFRSNWRPAPPEYKVTYLFRGIIKRVRFHDKDNAMYCAEVFSGIARDKTGKIIFNGTQRRN